MPEPTSPSIEELLRTNSQLAARIADIDRQATEAHVNDQVAKAVAASGVKLHPSALPQVVGLLRSQVSTIAHDGQTHIVGPGLRPLADHVRDRLQADDMSHFRVSQPAQGRPVDPRPRTFLGALGESLAPMTAAVGAGDAGYGNAPVDSGGSIGARLVRAAQDRAAAATDPRWDMTVGFGLRRPAGR